MPNMINVVTQMYVDGAWQSYPCYQAAGITVKVGPDTDGKIRPASITWQLQDPNLTMDPSNPASALFGKIGRNTPTRVRIGSGPNTITTCEATEWKPDRTPDHTPGGRGKAWVDVDSYGVLSRIGEWDDLLDSPMRRAISGLAGLLGYWPLEGGTSDTVRLSEVAGTGARPGTYSGTVTFSGDAGAGGSDKTITLGANGQLSGTFLRWSTSGWQFLIHIKLPALPGSATYGTLFTLRLSNANTVVWQINNSGFRVEVTAPDGTSLASSAFGVGSISVTNWVRYRLKVTVSGGTVTYEPAWYEQDAAVITGTTFTYAAGSTGALLSWSTIQMAYSNGAAYGHVFGTSDTTINITGDFDQIGSFNGYLGERAGSRILRLLKEQGITRYITGASADTPPMGRQKPGTLIDLLEQCRATDDGLFYDERNDLAAVTYRTRVHRMEQAVKLTLTRGVDVAPPLTPVLGPVLARNDITVSNYNDAEARAVQSSGAMSVLPPPAGIGRRKATVDVSHRWDETLDDRAAWELAKGTIPGRRYLQVTVDLMANPSLIGPISLLVPGDLIMLAGADPDPVPLHVYNLEWEVYAAPARVKLGCVPADVYALGIWDDTSTQWDATFSTVDGAVTAGAITVPVKNPVLADCWDTAAVPLSLDITGERVTVTAISAPVLSGGFYRQNLTCTRSVNGVVKAHVDGDAVELADPDYWGYY